MAPSQIRSASALVLGAAFVVAGSGLLANVVALRSSVLFSLGGASIIVAAYFAGFGVGAYLGPGLLRRFGVRRAYTTSVATVAASSVLLAILETELCWTVLRAATGWGAAVVFTVVESWLNENATTANRGRLLGGYMLAAQIGLLAGQVLITATGIEGPMAFLLAGGLYLLALGPSRCLDSGSLAETGVQTGFRAVWSTAAVGLLGVFASGIFVGGWLGAGPVFAAGRMGSIGGASAFMSTLVLAGLFLQWPMGLLADRFERMALVRLVCVSVATCAVLMVVVPGGGVSALAGAVALGALGFTLYPLCCAFVQERVSPTERSAAAAACLLCYSVGATLSPLLAMRASASLGENSLVYLTVLAMVMVLAIPAPRAARRGLAAAGISR